MSEHDAGSGDLRIPQADTIDLTLVLHSDAVGDVLLPMREMVVDVTVGHDGNCIGSRLNDGMPSNWASDGTLTALITVDDAIVVPIPRRDACLAAPWVLPDRATDGGLVRQACGGPDERQAVLTRAGTRAAGDEEQQAGLAALATRLRAGQHVVATGLGLCCDHAVRPAGGRVVPCLRVSLGLCQMSERDLAALIDEALAGVPAEITIGVSVRPESLVGARRTPPDRDCVPVPWGSAEYHPEGDRTPVAAAIDPLLGRLSSGECAHDGECMRAGCGNQCVPWTMSGPGTCEGYTNMDDALCGCVEGTCTWFVQ
jgi:hypothetical protein